METSTSGFGVVEAAIKEGKLPHIVTGGTYEHGGLFDRVTIFDHFKSRTFDRMSKTMSGFWKQTIPYIERNEMEDPTRIACRNVFGVLGIVPEDSQKRTMHFYQNNYRFEDNET